MYDGDGGRVKKTESGTTTVYVGSLYETIVSSQLSVVRKHIFAGSNRICTVDGGPSTVDYYFFHGDHLGSSNIITDETGTQVQLLEYTPVTYNILCKFILKRQ